MAAFTVLSVLAAANAVFAACPSPSGQIKPSVASGYSLSVVATGLSRPRGIAFDSKGRLLVVQSGSGSITAHTISNANGCTIASNPVTLISGAGLNHAIQVWDPYIFASDNDKAYFWPYDVTNAKVGAQQTLISGMAGTDHSTRTLELSKKYPGTIIVSRGSLANLDKTATNLGSGTAQVKAFDLTKRTKVYDFNTDGRVLAWGVRNEVGIAEHPLTGTIYGVENSADQINRFGVDVSNDNPGEELNSFGPLSDTTTRNRYYGYPWCLAAWGVGALPQNSQLAVGSQFAFAASPDLDNVNATDAWCSANTISPRLTFQAHMAPLDIKFNNTNGNDAWIAFHGSWDRVRPIGYRVSKVLFNNGVPVDPSTSTTAEKIIVANADNSKCPNNCLRPAGLAVDSLGRIFFSSDASGEIYMIRKV